VSETTSIETTRRPSTAPVSEGDDAADDIVESDRVRGNDAGS